MCPVQNLLVVSIACVAVHGSFAKDIVVERVTTELQRMSYGDSVDVVAIVNGNALLDGNSVDKEGFDSDAFRAEIDRVASPDSVLRLECIYQLGDQRVDRETRVRANFVLQQICEAAAFSKVRTSTVQTSASWEQNAVIAAQRFEPDAKEPIIKNDWVHVAPIRTRLSKMQYGEIDCVVEVLTPIDGRTKGLTAEFCSAIRDALDQLEFRPTGTLLFDLQSTSAGGDKLEGLFNSKACPTIPESAGPEIRKILQAQVDQYRPSPGLKFAQELGFKTIRHRHSPTSSAPETLLGKAAPEFRVELLDGNTMELSKLLDGRPALITFWGLACGPCRQEAPWLTRYHKQYVDRGFLILAVNAYDDSRDDVQQYVDSKKLEHAISLGGSDIADVYQVSAYPTSFWINRSGEVIDYDIGFSNPDRIERKLLQLIGESPSL